MKNMLSPKHSDTHLFSPAKPIRHVKEKFLIEIGLPKKFLPLFYRLNTPEKIQKYLKKDLVYNHTDTYHSFVTIAESKTADCFEAGVGFAYPLLYLHGYNPKIVMIHADNKIDVDHTLVAYRLGNKIGTVAKSNYPMLMDRPAVFSSLRDLVLTYYPHYVCEIKGHKLYGTYTVIGYSDPIDLVEKFGSRWFFLTEENALKHLYDHFVDSIYCTRIFSNERFPYPPEALLD